ncbi:reverse transcriptase [Trichonephila clavipes]|nr:reverse transcriptase [Trichonephila clavipes]
MPPVGRSQNEAHEILHGKGLEVRLSLALRTIQLVAAVARFRLTTGHDFIGVYLHWLGLTADEAYPLCVHVKMDGDHLLQCIGLDEYPIDDIGSRYCETRRQIVKKPDCDEVERNNAAPIPKSSEMSDIIKKKAQLFRRIFQWINE